jgi:hypothetical protein
MMNSKTKLKLCGRDGNAFAILGYALRAAREAEWPLEKINAFQKKATSGNYDNLLQTCMEYFDVE